MSEKPSDEVIVDKSLGSVLDDMWYVSDILKIGIERLEARDEVLDGCYDYIRKASQAVEQLKDAQPQNEPFHDGLLLCAQAQASLKSLSHLLSNVIGHFWEAHLIQEDLRAEVEKMEAATVLSLDEDTVLSRIQVLVGAEGIPNEVVKEIQQEAILQLRGEYNPYDLVDQALDDVIIDNLEEIKGSIETEEHGDIK